METAPKQEPWFRAASLKKTTWPLPTDAVSLIGAIYSNYNFSDSDDLQQISCYPYHLTWTSLSPHSLDTPPVFTIQDIIHLTLEDKVDSYPESAYSQKLQQSNAPSPSSLGRLPSQSLLSSQVSLPLPQSRQVRHKLQEQQLLGEFPRFRHKAIMPKFPYGVFSSMEVWALASLVMFCLWEWITHVYQFGKNVTLSLFPTFFNLLSALAFGSVKKFTTSLSRGAQGCVNRGILQR